MNETHLRRFSRFALLAGVASYAITVFTGAIQITGSGTSEVTGRMLGVSIGLILIALFVYALRYRREGGFGGLARRVGLALLLAIVQVVLGEITLWFETSPMVEVARFAVALTVMALLLGAAVRARARANACVLPGDVAMADARSATICAALGFAVVVFGAVVSNNLGAPEACQGFPLCNGIVPPEGGYLVQIHWAHRLLAFMTFFVVLYQMIGTWRRRGAASVRKLALAAAVILSLQVVIAAGLVLMHLPRGMRALHLAVGVTAWAVLTMWAVQARSHSSS